MSVVRWIIVVAPKQTHYLESALARIGGKRTLQLDRTKVRNSRIPSVYEIRSKYRKGSTVAERTADAVAEVNEDEAARAERQTSGQASVPWVACRATSRR